MRTLFLIILGLMILELGADFDFARGLYDDGLYEEAIREFEKIIDREPTSQEAARSMFLIGESYLQLGEYDLAGSNFKRLLEAYPDISFRDEALFNLALSNFFSQDYGRSASYFLQLIELYPLSEQSKKSLKYIVEAYYNDQEYEKVIMQGEQLINQYRGNPQIPVLYLFQANAYLQLKMVEEARSVIGQILAQYEGHNSYWEAAQLQIRILESEQGIEKAVEIIEQRLQNNDIPRQYEELFQAKLLELLLELEDYRQALPVAEELLEKFNNSDHLDRYIIHFSRCNLETGNHSRNLQDLSEHEKILRKSDLKPEYDLIIARSYYLEGDHENALQLLDDLLEGSARGSSLYFRSALTKAEIRTGQGYFYDSIEIYQQLIGMNYRESDLVLLKLGDVYFTNLNDPGKSARFFEQLLITFPASDYRTEASWKLSRCYRELDEYKLALKELESIDLEEIADNTFARQVINEKIYLEDFLIRNFEPALEKLITGVITYTEDSDPDKLRTELIEVLSFDLKNYEAAFSLLLDESGEEVSYRRSLILLKLLAKARLDGDPDLTFSRLKDLDEELADLENAGRQMWVNEIRLKKEVLLDDQISEETVTGIQDFLDSYETSGAANEFNLILHKYYYSREQYDLAANYASKLVNDDTIRSSDYNEAMIALGEFFYSMDEDENARKAYIEAGSAINLQKPSIWFHKAVVLYQTGYRTEALEMLDLLVNNIVDFPAFRSAIIYYSTILSDKEEYLRAIEVREKLAGADRDDDFYLSQFGDYLAAGDREKAKKSLMQVLEKDEQMLRSLAQLHYETNDLIMAEYTYQQLLQQNTGSLEYNRVLAEIAFRREEFHQAADFYERSDQIIGDNFSGIDKINILARQYITSLYRIDNRPQADRILKKYKSVLNQNDLLEVELEEGRYYSGIDSKKAMKIFNSLLKQDADRDLRAEAKFQRALLYLKDDEIEKAETDLEDVLIEGSSDLIQQAHLKLGTLRFSQENYQQALDHYYYVIENDSSGVLAVDAARNFAFVCKTMEEWQKAVAAYEMILERWGDEELESETIFDIAFCHYRDRKYQDAIIMFDRSIPLLEDTEMRAEAQYWLGESYYGLSDFQRAVTEFLKVGYNYPDYIHWSASAELRAGEIYVEIAEFDKAARIYQRIMDKYGESSQWGAEARNRYDSIK